MTVPPREPPGHSPTRAPAAAVVFLLALVITTVTFRTVVPDAEAATGGVVSASSLAAIVTLVCLRMRWLPRIEAGRFGARLVLALAAGTVISLVPAVVGAFRWGQVEPGAASGSLLFAPFAFALILRAAVAMAAAIVADELGWRGVLQPLLERAITGRSARTGGVSRLGAAVAVGVVWGLVQVASGGLHGFHGVTVPPAAPEWWIVVGECVILSLLIAILARGGVWQRVAIGALLRLGAVGGMGAAGDVLALDRLGTIAGVTCAVGASALVAASVRAVGRRRPP